MRKILLLAGVSILCMSCVAVPVGRPGYGGPGRPDAPGPGGPVRTAIPAKAVALGERAVAFKADHDVVPVRGYEGRFKSLFFVVEDNDIELFNVVITFANGEKESFGTRLVFREGSRSRSIALHGGERRITAIAFTYRTVGGWTGGQARVVVYGVR